MVLLSCLIWALSHRYTGLVQDGDIYGLQALARLQPPLRADIYLSDVSQDRYTYFSPLYAFFIRQLGLWNGSVALFTGCHVLFFSAAWLLIWRLSNAKRAGLSLALLIVAVGEYGAYGIFRFAENYLTARSLSEALVVAAIALAIAGRSGMAWAVIVLSFAIHPLMSLPGALLLVCLRIGPRRAVAAAAIALCIAGVAAVILTLQRLGGPLQLIDGQWLDVVHQRSQFLFINEWPSPAWLMHLRTFFCLALACLVLREPGIHRLCTAASIVGVSGLMLAWIAGSVGPVAILLQSQPWRWFWISSFVSIAVLGPLAATLWRDGRVGRTCAVLVVIAWVFPVANGTLMAGGAVSLWLFRGRLSETMLRVVGLTGYLVIAVVAAWCIGNAWSSLSAPLAENIDSQVFIGHTRAIFQMEPFCVLLVIGALWWLRSFATQTSVLASAFITTILLLMVLPGSLAKREGINAPGDIGAFKDWRDAIPPDATVLLVPTPVGAQFAWFTLGRTSYLSLDQSSGVVFSRATAAEVARRAEVLRPVEEPDWQISRRIGKRIKREDDRHPFTDLALRQICTDAALGFVIASENLQFPSLLHTARGAYNGSRLYNCGEIRAMGTD